MKGEEGNKKQPRLFHLHTSVPVNSVWRVGSLSLRWRAFRVLNFTRRCGFYLLRQLSEDLVFHSAPTLTRWNFPLARAQSVFAQLPPCWAATALSVTVVVKSWQRVRTSALGNVFVMLQFFISCFRTARMFLFAYVLVIVSPGELDVAFLYLFW